MRRSMGGLDAGAGLVRRVVWSAKSGLQALCNFLLFRVSNLSEHRTKAVFDLKLYLVGLSIKWYLTRVGSGLIVRM